LLCGISIVFDDTFKGTRIIISDDNILEVSKKLNILKIKLGDHTQKDFNTILQGYDYIKTSFIITKNTDLNKFINGSKLPPVPFSDDDADLIEVHKKIQAAATAAAASPPTGTPGGATPGGATPPGGTPPPPPGTPAPPGGKPG
jgi:hypothetical protein